MGEIIFTMLAIPIAKRKSQFRKAVKEDLRLLSLNHQGKTGRVTLPGESRRYCLPTQADAAAFVASPPAAFDACDKLVSRVSSLLLPRDQNNDYAAPTRYDIKMLWRRECRLG
jgi:hypothetical protein